MKDNRKLQSTRSQINQSGSRISGGTSSVLLNFMSSGINPFVRTQYLPGSTWDVSVTKLWPTCPLSGTINSAELWHYDAGKWNSLGARNVSTDPSFSTWTWQWGGSPTPLKLVYTRANNWNTMANSVMAACVFKY